MSFISLHQTGPVTALSCFAGHLLTGISSNVWVYRISDGKLLQTLSVLPACVVHGFRQDPCNSRVCVFGQKTLRLVRVLPGTGLLACASPLVELPDWIWDAAWLEGANQMCLALGHNVIVTLDMETHQLISTVHCTEKCILYCGRFLSTQVDCVVLAAGTVFNQVVLWSPQVAMATTDHRAEPFHRLTGHQGVIFNVDYREDLGLICSVSDDRSHRLYKVLFHTQACARCAGSTGYQGARSGHCIHDWQTMETCLLHAVYGHSARVWDARLLTSCFVSIGEDSTCCIWSYEGRVIHKFKGHKGKSIWSLCVDRGENLVFTGGGDHSVRMWNLHYAQEAVRETETSSLDLQLDEDDTPRNTKLLSVHRILVITKKGQLILYDRSLHTRQVVMCDEAFASYTEMSVSPNRQLVAIGNIKGTLCILGQFDADPKVRVAAQICEGKVFSIHWMDDSRLLTTAPDGVVNLWNLQDGTIEKIATCELTTSKQRFVSAATLLHHGNQYLLCGDKMGSLYLYLLQDQEGILLQTFHKVHGKAGVTHVSCHGDRVYSAGRDGTYKLYKWTGSGLLNLIHSNRVCKGMEWIERLVILEEGPDNIQVQAFYTNLFVVWSVQQNQKLLEIPCGGGHRAWDYCCHGDMASFVYVKAREVKVTSIATKPNQVLIKEALHGRKLHDARFVSSTHDSKGCPVHAVVTCSEDTNICLALMCYENSLPHLRVCHTLSSHISSVQCLAVCESRSAADRKLIFSGGGRAQLKVWRVEFGRNEDSHSSVSNKDTETLLSDTAREGDSAKACGKPSGQSSSVAVGDVHSGQTCSPAGDCGRSPRQHSVGAGDSEQFVFTYEGLCGLHLNNVCRKAKKPWKYPVEKSDPETRITDLCVVTLQGSRSLYIVCAACSDGVVKLILFDEDEKEVSVIASSECTEHCILKISHVVIAGRPGSFTPGVTGSMDTVVLLTAATDGRVAFWDITEICQHVRRCRTMIVKSWDDSGESANLFTERNVDSHCESQSCDIESVSLEHVIGENKPEENVIAQEMLVENVLTPMRRDELNVGSGVSRMSECCSIELHQSGINSLHIQQIGNQFILLTGGDDNAIKVTLVTMETADNVTRIHTDKTGGHSNPHSAQITGICLLDTGHILSASVDQRLCLWEVVHSGHTVELQLVCAQLTSVSDVANVDTWVESDTTYILVSGTGLELFRLQHGDPCIVSQPGASLAKVIC